MSSLSFRPQAESLDGRCLPSGNLAMTIGDAAPAALLGTTTEHNGSDRLGGLEFSAMRSQMSLDRLSKNPAMTIGDAAPAALLGTTTEHNGSDRLGGLEFSAMRLQMSLDRVSKMYDTLSTILQRISRVQETIVGHLK